VSEGGLAHWPHGWRSAERPETSIICPRSAQVKACDPSVIILVTW